MLKHLPGKGDENHENVYHGSRWNLIRSLTFRIKSRIEIHSNVTVVHKERDREYYRCISLLNHKSLLLSIILFPACFINNVQHVAKLC